MDALFAPWRMIYVTQAEKSEGCIFCDFPKEDRDAERKIVYRGKTAFVIMNAFPYNPGHLMVAPYRHTADFEALDPEEIAEMGALAQKALRVIKATMSPHGFNLGMNLGRVAGAGIDAHLHLHIVPRWNGDTNFMPVIAETKTIPEALETTYANLTEAWKQA